MSELSIASQMADAASNANKTKTELGSFTGNTFALIDLSTDASSLSFASLSFGKVVSMGVGIRATRR